MNRLDELAGWAAANEEQLRAFVVQLDELVADQVPAAVGVAERLRVAKAAAWDAGWHQGVDDAGDSVTSRNPYELDDAEAVTWDRTEEAPGFWPEWGVPDGS